MNDMRNIITSAVLAAALALQGCVLVIGNEIDDEQIAAEIEDDVSNRALAREVDKALDTDAALDGARIDVFARGGNVYLRGHVGDVAQIERAVSVARAVPGVTKVVARLTVEVE
ncbi:MAG TPA: BON domain-containing protein [Gammaproteobacteria bacterium]|nr:BON domain-containing protein [Gammaproteobacteria bacterium]